MSPNDPLQQYRDAFGDELRRAGDRRDRRRRREWQGAGVAGVAALASVVAFALPSTGTRIDVLAEARAAVADRPGVILHYAVRSESTLPVSRADQRRARGCQPRALPEMWVATSSGPPRYRTRLPQPRCGTSTIDDRIATGPLEVAYGDRTQWLYAPADGWMQELTDLPAAADEQAAVPLLGDPRLQGSGVSDPVDQIRDMLARGRVRDAGTVRGPGGRQLRRLVGSYTERRGDPKAQEDWPVRVDYLVDADTFAPVVLRTTFRQSVPRDIELGWGKSPTVHRMITDTQRFEIYERLPLTKENEALLRPAPAPGTDVIRRTAGEQQTTRRTPSAAERARAARQIREQIRAGLRLRADY